MPCHCVDAWNNTRLKDAVNTAMICIESDQTDNGATVPIRYSTESSSQVKRDDEFLVWPTIRLSLSYDCCHARTPGQASDKLLVLSRNFGVEEKSQKILQILENIKNWRCHNRECRRIKYLVIRRS